MVEETLKERTRIWNWEDIILNNIGSRIMERVERDSREIDAGISDRALENDRGDES